MSITITHPGGARVIEAYRVLRDSMEYALRGEANRAGKLVAYGDRGLRPAVLEVEVTFQEATFAESLRLAQLVVEEAERATSVTLPRGVRAVDGIVDDELVTQGPLVRLRLSFEPTGGSYS